MVAMNFFKTGASDNYKNSFGEYSFALKPAEIRYTVKLMQKAKKPGPETDMKGGKIDNPSLILRM